MSADIQVTRRSQHRTSAWSGGETTELAIFPRDSQYAARDFEWRVSSATVTSETSEFTRLPGYSRLLLLLAGELRLQSADHHEMLLHPGEQCSFQGDKPMTSYGLATDFNLMLGPGWGGNLTHVVLAPGERHAWHPADTTQHALVYCRQGQVSIAPANGPTHNLDTGDLMWATSDARRLGSFDIVSESNSQSKEGWRSARVHVHHHRNAPATAPHRRCSHRDKQRMVVCPRSSQLPWSGTHYHIPVGKGIEAPHIQVGKGGR